MEFVSPLITKVLAFAGTGLVLLIISGLVGYYLIGKMLNLDIRVRAVILTLTFVIISCVSCNPNWNASLYTRSLADLMSELFFRTIIIGLAIGQMFGERLIVRIEREPAEEVIVDEEDYDDSEEDEEQIT